MTEILRLPDDEAAAQYRTDIAGWVSRNGVFYGKDKKAARWAGATHVRCDKCGATTKKKGYTHCDACREAADIARYNAMPRRESREGEWLYSDARDKYYASCEDAADDLLDGETLADLRLIICEPNYVSPLEADYCVDEMPDDTDIDLPAEVQDAMDAFNNAVKGIVLSWSPGKFALEIPATTRVAR